MKFFSKIASVNTVGMPVVGLPTVFFFAYLQNQNFRINKKPASAGIFLTHCETG